MSSVSASHSPALASMHRSTPVVALVAVLCGMATGCSHVVRIDSAPGAEILVNGQSIGSSPATYTETTGAQDSVQVTARLKGRERTVSVERNHIDAAPIGVGAAVGAGA